MSDQPILQELHRLEKRLSDRISCVEDKLDKVRTEDIPGIRVEVAAEISALKVKAGLWGLAAGVLGSVGAILVAMAAK